MHAHHWYVVGAQILMASGWRPDCAQEHTMHLGRALPPRPNSGAPVLTTMNEMLDAGQEAKAHLLCEGTQEKEPAITIYACSFFQEGYGISCACIVTKTRIIGVQGWVLGEDRVSLGPPIYVDEAPLMHALYILRAMLGQKGEHSLTTEDLVEIQAGGRKPMQEVHNWFRTGDHDLQSSAASRILETLADIKEKLPCMLKMGALPTSFFESPSSRAGSPAGALTVTAHRLYKEIIPLGCKKWKGRISRLPWTKDETKAHVKRKYLIDEKEVLLILAQEGSLACQIHAELNLTRAMIKATLQALAGDRKHQTVFASVACGAFFKYYGKSGNRLQVKCTQCNETSTLKHIETHVAEAQPKSEAIQDEWVEYLVKLIQGITPQTRVLPIPIPTEAKDTQAVIKEN